MVDKVRKFKYERFDSGVNESNNITGVYLVVDDSECPPFPLRMKIELNAEWEKNYAVFKLVGMKKKGTFLITSLRKIFDSETGSFVFYGDIKGHDGENSFLIFDFRTENEMNITVFDFWMPLNPNARLLFIKNYAFWKNYKDINQLMDKYGEATLKSNLL